MRDCAIRDAVALVRFFAWLEAEISEGRAEKYDEVDVAEKLRLFRTYVFSRSWIECILFHSSKPFISNTKRVKGKYRDSLPKVLQLFLPLEPTRQ
jgi:hypothetical protein